MMKDKIKRWLKSRLSYVLSTVAEPEKPYGDAYWYEDNFWEPPVQIVLRDLCKPGDTVFDIGSNLGGLTTVMSRAVGLRGAVCAFEASPRIVGKCQRNLILQGCNNVQVYHAAIYSKSHQNVSIYAGGHLNDSIYPENSKGGALFTVKTLAIDDFVRLTGLVPNLLKLDIEGAEFEAVMGMLNTIENHKPHLILETQPSDTQCLDLLIDRGYMAIDLNTYKQIKGFADYPKGVGIRNNLYIHQDRILETPYQLPFHFLEVAQLQKEDFLVHANGSVEMKNSLSLDKGRYLIYVDFKAEGTDNEMMCGVKTQNRLIFRYHTYTKLLADSYKDWIIHLNEASEIKLYFDFLANTNDPSFLVGGIRVLRITNFDNLPQALFV
jgi:FkbM family methyltransferase